MTAPVVRLRGGVAVITGASSGIGEATARAFVREGAVVVLSARREDRLQALARGLSSNGGRAVAIACDVSERAQVEALADRVKTEFGRCDVLVNNAGVPGGGPFAEMSMDQAEHVTRINYLGVLYGTKAFLPMMLAAGRGHIVNVASLAGRFALPGSSVYSATKHAVVAFSESLHYELQPHGLLVTTVNPGLVRTEAFPHSDAKRVMKPERIAEVIVDVVKHGKAPEVSVPKWLSALQIVRLVAPPAYHFSMRQAVKRGLRSTRVDESNA